MGISRDSRDSEGAMRTLMLIVSVMMIGGGIFCVANGSVAFITVAFIIGLLLVILGIIEMIIGVRAHFVIPEKSVSLRKDGILITILGIIIFSGIIGDDVAAQTMFASWLLIEGIVSFNKRLVDIVHITMEERFEGIINIALFVVGILFFYNAKLFHLGTTLTVGIAMILIGIKRYSIAYVIDYVRPSFVTGNEEKLYEALDEEKRAIAKAKEGIREQKNARRRITKIQEDIAAEQDVMNAAAIRRQERELEKRAEEGDFK